jgi:hypothetical protein
VKGTTHSHPNATLDRMAQYGGMILAVVMIGAGLGQMALAFAGLPLFFLSGIITLVLIAPVMLLPSATPAVTVSAEGITIQPRVWRDRFVGWDAVRAVKPYPLLPPKDIEIERRTFVGRKRYRPAEGIMLVIPSLPVYYRFTGLFTGEGFTGVIGLTNRTHTEYEALVQQVEKHTGLRTED